MHTMMLNSDSIVCVINQIMIIFLTIVRSIYIEFFVLKTFIDYLVVQAISFQEKKFICKEIKLIPYLVQLDLC